MILNVYKPVNWTSFDVVAKLRGILGTKKIGHAGTLDPLADGVLIVLTDKDTKKQDELMYTNKEYIAKVALGLDSDSYDLETELTENKNYKGSLDFEDLKKYSGTIKQTVPPYSAVKVKGKRLYEMARNKSIDSTILPVKNVNVYNIEILDFVKKDYGVFTAIDTVTLKINCSKGFYVRSFAHDLNGVLVGLTRTKVGEYLLEDSLNIKDLKSLDLIK